MARVHLLGHLSSTDTATDRIYLSSFRIGSKNALRNYLVWEFPRLRKLNGNICKFVFPKTGSMSISAYPSLNGSSNAVTVEVLVISDDLLTRAVSHAIIKYPS